MTLPFVDNQRFPEDIQARQSITMDRAPKRHRNMADVANHASSDAFLDPNCFTNGGAPLNGIFLGVGDRYDHPSFTRSEFGATGDTSTVR